MRQRDGTLTAHRCACGSFPEHSATHHRIDLIANGGDNLEGYIMSGRTFANLIGYIAQLTDRIEALEATAHHD